MTTPDTKKPSAPSAEAPLDLSRAARAQAPWAGIAAAAMLFFGFTATFDDARGAQLLGYTLKCGGIAMGASAVLLFTGWPFALFFDGVVAILIGIALAASGLLWFSEIRAVDLQGLLELAFGYIFFNSGRRGLMDYLRANPLFIDTASEAGTDAGQADSSSGAPAAPAAPPGDATDE